MTAAVAVLWDRFRAHGDAEARRELLDSYLGLARRCARDLGRRIGYAVEFDDLLGAATLGLVQALEGFDPARGLAFSTYAMRRIRGAILDELRSRDWRPRSVRARARQLAAAERSLGSRLGRPPEVREVALALGMDLTQVHRLRAEAEGGVMVSLTGPAAPGRSGGHRLEDALADPAGEGGIHGVALADTHRYVREALAALPPRERTVLTLYYYEELSLKQIAATLQVTESRVSQIRAQAIRRLRERCGVTPEDA
jgi:RNA polymerase sigma factor FliA